MRLSTYVMGVPAAMIAVIVAVANRQGVEFSLDPFSQTTPALALHMPLFVLLFLTFGAGVLLGGAAMRLSRRPPAASVKQQPKPDSNLLPPRK